MYIKLDDQHEMLPIQKPLIHACLYDVSLHPYENYRYRQKDSQMTGQTDDLQWQYPALHCMHCMGKTAQMKFKDAGVR